MKKFMSKNLAAAVAIGLLTATTFTAVPVKAADTTIVNSNFENGNDGWSNMGNCNVMQASWVKHNGNSCLYVGNRQDSWTGAAYRLDAGSTYNISGYWFSWGINNNKNMKLTVTYKDNSGNNKYETIAQNTGAINEWHQISGNITIPSDARDAAVYFETSQDRDDYYLDDVKIEKVSSGNSQPSQPWQPSQPTNPGSSINMQNMKIDIFCPGSSMDQRPCVAYGSFQHKTYYSSTTRSNRGFNILLPANYNPQKQYPVLYVLHGIFGDENSMAGNGIERIAANLAADGVAKEMIIVLPNMFAATNGAQPGFSEAGVQGYDNFVNDLTNDLMPYIEKNYSVKTGRENTAIAGFSMGGRETLFIGLTRANKFGYVCACCPAPGATPAVDNFMIHKGQLSEDQFKVADPANNPYILMIAAGTNDGVVGTFPKKYSEILTRNGQEHVYYEVPGGGHDNTTISSGLNNFIRAIFHN